MAIALTRQHGAALAALAAGALTVPLLLLPAPRAAPRRVAPVPAAIVPRAAPPLAAAYRRPLFEGAAAGEAAAGPAGNEAGDASAAPPAPVAAPPELSAPIADAGLGAPVLVGIAGRLSAGDAVAMVRTRGGRSRALRVGDSVDGWRLAALSADAAFFVRGTQQVRVGINR